MMKTDWELAGVGHSLQGGLQRTLAAHAWQRPAEISLEGEELRWTAARGAVVRATTGNLLESFRNLADAPADRILAFAEKWGVLELCSRHDFPCRHPFLYWPTLPPDDAGEDRMCSPRGIRLGDLWEPVEAWRTWARRVTGTLDVATALHLGRTVKP